MGILVINVESTETRVALVENGSLVELQSERRDSQTCVGNVYLGKVLRVLPGLQAAFVDIGQPRAAFLRVQDLLRPVDDTEATAAPVAPATADGAQATSPDALDEARPWLPNGHLDAADDVIDGELDDSFEDLDDHDEFVDGPVEVTVEITVEDDRDGQANHASETGNANANHAGDEANAEHSPRSPHGTKALAPPVRRPTTVSVSRNTPISQVIHEGQNLVVQVIKNPMGTKGARVTTNISLAGRYLVYAPCGSQVGVSRRIGSTEQRQKIRSLMLELLPDHGGWIARTVATNTMPQQIQEDIRYLQHLWNQIQAKAQDNPKAPCLLFAELDLVLRTARDLFCKDVQRIIVDNALEYERLRQFVASFVPVHQDQIELHSDDEPIFDAYGIEDEIARALCRKVPLKSGGHLIIDEAEALTAIDVNTGSFVGQNKDMQEAAIRTNLEAIEEIAFQLRLRNIGGLIAIDLIDMHQERDRTEVLHRLKVALEKDRAQTDVYSVPELGLIAMTRKRNRDSLSKSLNEPCFYCDGTGRVQSRHTVALDILRQLRRESAYLEGSRVVVNAHPSVIAILRVEQQPSLRRLEKTLKRPIKLAPNERYHIEQFDLQGR